MLEPELIVLIYGLLVGLVAGALGGTLAGIAGIGGGLVYVPMFYAFMPGEQDYMGIQIFGSLVAIVLTGIFSAHAHWRLGHVHAPSFKELIPGLMIGAGIGLWSTLHIPEALLLLGLAFLDAWIAFDYGRPVRKQGHSQPSLVLCSGPIGYISGCLGIGGGTMLVPLLRRWLTLRQAVGTSAMCGMAMAATAVMFNFMLEIKWRELLADEMMFLAGAWFGVIIIAPRTTGWSAQLHVKMPEATMRTALKAMFFLLSAALLTGAIMAWNP